MHGRLLGSVMVCTTRKDAMSVTRWRMNIKRSCAEQSVV